MSFIHSSLIIMLILLSSIIRSDDNEVLYFEVLEPFDINYTFQARQAIGFGTKFDHLLKNVYLIPTKPLKACSRLENAFAVKGNIALIERGDCSFITKTLHAQESGAIAVVVVNDAKTETDNEFFMTIDLTGRTVKIPAVFLPYNDGQLILNSIRENNLIGARINIPLNFTYIDMLNVRQAPGSHWL